MNKTITKLAPSLGEIYDYSELSARFSDDSSVEVELNYEMEMLTIKKDLQVEFALNVEEEPIPPQVFNYLSRLNAFRLQENAWRALDAGDTKRATSLLEAAATQLFDMGYGDLAQAAMLEVGYIAQGGASTGRGRKKLRYGTRSLSVPSIPAK